MPNGSRLNMMVETLTYVKDRKEVRSRKLVLEVVIKCGFRSE